MGSVQTHDTLSKAGCGIGAFKTLGLVAVSSLNISVQLPDEGHEYRPLDVVRGYECLICSYCPIPGRLVELPYRAV